MEAGAGGRAMVVVMMVVVVATMTGSHIRGAQAQMDCASKLIPCADAISNTSIKPGKECCSNLAEAVKNELKCLCDVYNSPSIFKNLNINATRALEIPGLCGVSGDLSRCKSATSAPSPSSSAVPSPTPGSDNKQGNGALRLTWSWKPLWAFGLLWMSLIMV